MTIKLGKFIITVKNQRYIIRRVDNDKLIAIATTYTQALATIKELNWKCPSQHTTLPTLSA
jgi:hypothetical protein